MNRLSNVFQGIVPAWCVLFVSTVASPLSAEKVDRELAGLKGPVESVRTEQAFFYEEYPFWREEKPVPTTIEHYNRDGCLVERVSCSPDVDAQRKQVRTFDAENRLIEVSNYDGDGNLVRKETHTYDETGNPLSVEIFDAGSCLLEKTTFVRDGSGLLYSTKTCGPNSELFCELSYFYGLDRRLTGTFRRASEEDGNETTRYEYDEEGRMRVYSVFSANGSIKSRYERSGNVRIHCDYGSEGALAEKRILTLNANEDPVREDYYGSGNTILEKWSYDYELDSAGNWIKKMASKWIEEPNRAGRRYFAPQRSEYRTITYFPE